MNHADRIENLPRFHPSRKTTFSYSGNGYFKYSENTTVIAVNADWIRGDAVWSDMKRGTCVRMPLWVDEHDVKQALVNNGSDDLRGFTEAWKALQGWLNPPLPGTVPRKRTRLERYVRSVWRALCNWRYV